MREIDQTSYSQVLLSDITQKAEQNPLQLVKDSEAYYNAQLEMILDRLNSRERRCQIVIISGPSGSGKTTTANKLRERLVGQGVGAKVLEMDNFYKGIASYSVGDDGRPDMEAIDTLDTDLLNKCLRELIVEGRSKFPIFDFANQERLLDEEEVALGEGDILIMEGIHALNPKVIEDISSDKIFKIYASVRTKFADQGKDILRPSDIRLIRRMVRDMLFRGYSAVQTVEYWDKVREGERNNIDPFRDDVDFKMDTTIDYETCTWHQLLHDLIEEVTMDEIDEYPKIMDIINGLKLFPELSPELIPEDSLLREFIG